MEDTLTKLARYEHEPGKADVFPETDFLPRIQADAVADEILSSYKRRVEFLRSVKYSILHDPG